MGKRTRSQVARDKVQASAAEAVGTKEDAEAEEGDDASDHDGVTVHVHWGEEKFCPIKSSYSTFTVGPFVLSVDIPPGKDLKAAVRKISAELEAVGAEQFETKLQSFLDRLSTSQRAGANR